MAGDTQKVVQDVQQLNALIRPLERIAAALEELVQWTNEEE
jgi:hypothetical protein